VNICDQVWDATTTENVLSFFAILIALQQFIS